ncbi:hypothetical protein NL676_029196 [Syzygium grande]|nr:hypothetical protein NL676_029196 [Syzygium grande]
MRAVTRRARPRDLILSVGYDWFEQPSAFVLPRTESELEGSIDKNPGSQEVSVVLFPQVDLEASEILCSRFPHQHSLLLIVDQVQGSPEADHFEMLGQVLDMKRVCRKGSPGGGFCTVLLKGGSLFGHDGNRQTLFSTLAIAGTPSLRGYKQRQDRANGQKIDKAIPDKTHDQKSLKQLVSNPAKLASVRIDPMEQTPEFVIRHTEQLDDEPRVYVKKPLDEGGIFRQGTQGPAHASPACLTSILNMISGLKEGDTQVVAAARFGYTIGGKKISISCS